MKISYSKAANVVRIPIDSRSCFYINLKTYSLYYYVTVHLSINQDYLNYEYENLELSETNFQLFFDKIFKLDSSLKIDWNHKLNSYEDRGEKGAMIFY